MSLRGSDGPPSGASSGAPFLQHRSQRDLWFNTSFTSAAPPKVLALDLSKTKNLDASVADTPHNSSAVSVVPVPCKILFPLLDNDYIPFKDPQGNRTVLNNLVRYLEVDSLGPQEKLKIVRCNQGFLTAFFSFLTSLHSESCVLLFLHLEMIKDIWSVLPPEILRKELQDFKSLYVDPNGALFSNISAVACQTMTDGLNAERLTVRCLAYVEQEVNEMVFGNLQSSRAFFEKLPDSHPLIQGQSLRDMPTIGRGLSSSRSKDQAVTSAQRRVTTMMSSSDGPQSVAEGVFSDLDKLVWEIEVSLVYNVLVALRPVLEPEDFSLVTRHFMYICGSILRVIPLCLHAAAKETSKREASVLSHTVESSTISLPLTIDLAVMFFYDDAAFGSGSLQFWSLFSSCSEFKELIELSSKRLAGADLKLTKKAVQLFPALLERFYESANLMSSAFLWLLRAIEYFKSRASQAVLVLVVGEQLVRQKHYFLLVFRDVLIRLAERSSFFSSPETTILNHFLGHARESWELFWENIFPPQSAEFTARKVMDEHLSWVSIEAIRGKPAFTQSEEKLLQLLKQHENHLAHIPEFVELVASVQPLQSPDELRQSAEALKNESLSTQLAHVLAHRMREFESFLSKSLSDEPLMFWIDASENQLSALMCRNLYVNYIAPNAKRQICFSRDAAENMQRCLENNPVQLAALDKALALLLAECSTMLHQSAIDFLSAPSEGPLKPEVPSLTLQLGGPSSQSSSLGRTEQSLSPHSPNDRRKMSMSAKSILLSFKSKRKQLEEVAKMEAEEKLAWILKRHRAEFTEFAEKNFSPSDKKALYIYFTCVDTQGRRLDVKGAGKEANATETLKSCLALIVPGANLFLATMMGKSNEKN